MNLNFNIDEYVGKLEKENKEKDELKGLLNQQKKQR